MDKLRTIGRKLAPSTRFKVKLPEKKALPFYQSPEWLGLMAEIIAKRGKRCEDPDHDPKRSRTSVRIMGDHIVEIRDGGARLDKRNIMLRCIACHNRKSARERRRRYQGNAP